jgi:hypothetical protein
MTSSEGRAERAEKERTGGREEPHTRDYLSFSSTRKGQVGPATFAPIVREAVIPDHLRIATRALQMGRHCGVEKLFRESTAESNSNVVIAFLGRTRRTLDGGVDRRTSLLIGLRTTANYPPARMRRFHF